MRGQGGAYFTISHPDQVIVWSTSCPCMEVVLAQDVPTYSSLCPAVKGGHQCIFYQHSRQLRLTGQGKAASRLTAVCLISSVIPTPGQEDAVIYGMFEVMACHTNIE